jgi:23S rRNA (uracil1939-C5)-methyltransferase
VLAVGAEIELLPERPVVGGRMLCRHGDDIVLVQGAIPGERVRAQVERRQQQVWFAATREVLAPSPDRCHPGPDPGCGGMAFAHIAYRRQCELKAGIVADAMRRIARFPIPAPVPVTQSPTQGYRARYRVHADQGRLGFYREGTHEVCDPAATGQLAAASLACLEDLGRRLAPDAAREVSAFECMENLSNVERAINLTMRDDVAPSRQLLSSIEATAGVTGISWTDVRGARVVAVSGCPWVVDPVSVFLPTTGPPSPLPAPGPVIRRRAAAFFQANRFLTPVLVEKALSWTEGRSIVDLYAGVGLFAVCLAARGHTDITAIEGDRISGEDLTVNASAYAAQVRVRRTPVEEFLQRTTLPDDATLIVDPPRTGMSRAAMQGILAARARRIVYVSCDIATLARDTRRLLDAGYTLQHLEALDMFPNTPHVETLAVFDHQAQ